MGFSHYSRALNSKAGLLQCQTICSLWKHWSECAFFSPKDKVPWIVQTCTWCWQKKREKKKPWKPLKYFSSLSDAARMKCLSHAWFICSFAQYLLIEYCTECLSFRAKKKKCNMRNTSNVVILSTFYYSSVNPQAGLLIFKSSTDSLIVIVNIFCTSNSQATHFQDCFYLQ